MRYQIVSDILDILDNYYDNPVQSLTDAKKYIDKDNIPYSEDLLLGLQSNATKDRASYDGFVFLSYQVSLMTNKIYNQIVAETETEIVEYEKISKEAIDKILSPIDNDELHQKLMKHTDNKLVTESFKKKLEINVKKVAGEDTVEEYLIRILNLLRSTINPTYVIWNKTRDVYLKDIKFFRTISELVKSPDSAEYTTNAVILPEVRLVYNPQDIQQLLAQSSTVIGDTRIYDSVDIITKIINEIRSICNSGMEAYGERVKLMLCEFGYTTLLKDTVGNLTKLVTDTREGKYTEKEFLTIVRNQISLISNLSTSRLNVLAAAMVTINEVPAQSHLVVKLVEEVDKLMSTLRSDSSWVA